MEQRLTPKILITVLLKLLNEKQYVDVFVTPQDLAESVIGLIHDNCKKFSDYDVAKIFVCHECGEIGFAERELLLTSVVLKCRKCGEEFIEKDLS